MECACEILQATMLGGAPQDEDFPLDDNDDFDPNNFPPPPPRNFPIPPDFEALQGLGWNEWNNQDNPEHPPEDDAPIQAPFGNNQNLGPAD